MKWLLLFSYCVVVLSITMLFVHMLFSCLTNACTLIIIIMASEVDVSSLIASSSSTVHGVFV